MCDDFCDLTKISPDAFQEDALQHHIFESSNFTKQIDNKSLILTTDAK